MKKAIAIIMALIIMLALSGCFSPQKAIENVIKSQTGVDVDISNDGETVTISGKDGDDDVSYTIGGQKWPSDKMGDLPELKCTVLSTVSTGDGSVVVFEGVSRDDAKAYIQKYHY